MYYIVVLIGLIVLFAYVVFGQNNYFGFGSTTLNYKPRYNIRNKITV